MPTNSYTQILKKLKNGRAGEQQRRIDPDLHRAGVNTGKI
jgi:hypothetical protein